MDRPDPRAIVLRFPPGPDSVVKILKEAKYNHRHHQRTRAESWYRLSVWCDLPRPGESVEDVLLRLVHDAGLGQIRLEDVRNSFFWWTSASTLYEAGFDLVKDGEDDEPQNHYSVDLGLEPSREVVERFVTTFSEAMETRRFMS